VPTVFADVTSDMTIAREAIFGPVLAILGYRDVEEAIRIANDTPYGLAGYVQGAPEEAEAVALRLRAGQTMLNGADYDFTAPCGGYRQSGNGREWGKYAFADFLEYKAVIGVGRGWVMPDRAEREFSAPFGRIRYSRDVGRRSGAAGNDASLRWHDGKGGRSPPRRGAIRVTPSCASSSGGPVSSSPNRTRC